MRVDTLTATPIPAARVALPRADARVISPALDVAINGATRRFEPGTARNAIVGSLDDIQGLTARITDDGRLQFVTDDARQMVIAEIMADEPGFTEALIDSLFAAVDLR